MRRLLSKPWWLMGGLVAIFVVSAPHIRIEAAAPQQPHIEEHQPQFELHIGDEWTTEPIEGATTMAGLTWTGAGPEQALVRGMSDGKWGDWYELSVDDDHAPDPNSEEWSPTSASSPAYLGEVDAIQFRVRTRNATSLKAVSIDTSGRHLDFWKKLGRTVASITFTSPLADAAPAKPTIIPRTDWGAEQCVKPEDEDPTLNEGVQAAFVHHTAGSNSYTENQAPGIVLGHCFYHVNTRGWKDIGYNFLVDRFGNVYEGRAGGVENPVQGAHTGGFNSYSTGVALMGSFESTSATGASITSLENLLAWKLDVHHVDPTGASTLVSFGSSKYPAGTSVVFDNISGHRDASVTTCPGDEVYELLDGMQATVRSIGLPKIYDGYPSVDPVTGGSVSGYESVGFDFEFSTSTNWKLVIRNLSGKWIASWAGSGASGSVTWNGTSGGAPVPGGEYISILTGEVSGQDPPRPNKVIFRMGTILEADHDGDGLGDLAYRGLCGPAQPCWRTHRGTGTAFSAVGVQSSFWADPDSPIAGVASGDLNGDGAADVTYRGECDGSPCWVAHPGGPSGIEAPYDWGNGAWFSAETQDLISGDFNGDGRSDIVYRGLCRYEVKCWRTQLSTGSAFTAGQHWGNGAFFSVETSRYGVVSGDFNADGKDDLAYRGFCGSSGNTCWRVQLSTSSGFTGGQDWGDGAFWSHESDDFGVLAGDFDGDGDHDLAYRGYCGTLGSKCWRVQLSTGAGFTGGLNWGNGAFFSADSDDLGVVAADFDGDGDSDLAYRGFCGAYGSDCWRVQLSTGSSFTSGRNWGNNAWFSGETDRLNSGDFR